MPDYTTEEPRTEVKVDAIMDDNSGDFDISLDGMLVAWFDRDSGRLHLADMTEGERATLSIKGIRFKNRHIAIDVSDQE